MVAKVPIIPTSASAQHSGSGSAYNRGNFQGWDGREKWRAEADETENYTYAIALQNEA